MSIIFRLSRHLSSQNATLGKRHLCSKVSFSKTINLPKSDYPMKHSRALELEVEKQAKFDDLYKSELTFKSGDYVLHDGPPYANGDVHFGHAINKILKDIIIKRKTIENKRVNYVPGWDCHGLPIELKAISEDEALRVDAEEIRRRARDLAMNAINTQRSSFQQWFLSADFNSPYLTFKPDFIINQLTVFNKLYRKDLIFRDYMPVYYSPSTRTALAEAELQYNHQHVSLSAYVKYPLLKDDTFYRVFGDSFPSISAMIWTTTPWTLLANEAIAVGESLEYSLIRICDKRFEDDVFLVATDLVPTLQEVLKKQITIERTVSGESLIGLRYEDRVQKRTQASSRELISSQHVSITKGGTGLVHMAPNHGFDDYKAFQTNSPKLDYRRESIVNDNGMLMAKDVMSSPVEIIQDNKASKFVVEELFQDQIILVHEHEHSYPYDWRSGKPIIIKPSSQWFLRMDSIREQCLEELSKVQLYPEKMRKEFVHHLSMRPNWCLSRQRKWGVPIPVFYSRRDDPECMKPILEDESFQRILHKIKQEGSCDFWWRDTEVPANFYSGNRPQTEEWIKGMDILDIWFDSGTSWLSVLGEDTVADLYLEGIDQIRGWFQSSLITSVALRGKAPYKAIMIHGFALDKEGKKMSKSLGNVIRPMDIVECESALTTKKSHQKKGDKNRKTIQTGCGVDGLRLWIAKYACSHHDCNVNTEEFQTEIQTTINRIRNTLKFMLAYLTDNRDRKSILTRAEMPMMPLMDRYILNKIWLFNERCNKNYDELNFGDVCGSVVNHVMFDIATFYFTRAKDRLYCDPKDSFNYRSALTVLHYAYHTIGYQLSPIIPHVMLQANQSQPFELEQIFHRNHFNDINELFSHLFREQFESVEEFDETMHFLLRLIDSDINPTSNTQNLAQTEGILYRLPSHKIAQKLENISQKDLRELLQLANIKIDENYEIYEDEIVENETESEEEKEPKEVVKRMKFEAVSLSQCSRCRLFNIENDSEQNIKLCERCSKCQSVREIIEQLN